jgi:xylulokinase
VYLGIDIGTSAAKAIVIDDSDSPVAEATAPLAVSRPQPLWSEQQPFDWWRAVERALDDLAARSPKAMMAVRSIGLSGQMLGVTLLDAADAPIRPALLWNDGRATTECALLHQRFADFVDLVGCRAMPGFPAPKLLWLARHEPANLERARRVLLTKDYVRLRLTGEVASDRADASATLLMETLRGDWHDGIVAACGIDRALLPRLVESAEISGTLRRDLASRWHLPTGTPVVGGGGDNMCAGVGVGAVAAGSAYLSLGTSGVYFVANDAFVPAHSGGMHTHRHAVAGLYAQHAVVLSAGGALAWIAGLLGAGDIGRLVAETEAAGFSPEETPVFTPYLAGERTPHDDPSLTAAFSSLTYNSGPLHLVQAVMEGVALALADGHAALAATGARINRISLTGGGARSELWARLAAAAIGLPLFLSAERHAGPAIGAARLSRLAVGGPLLAAGEEQLTSSIVPVDPVLRDQLGQKKVLFHKHLELSLQLQRDALDATH